MTAPDDSVLPAVRVQIRQAEEKLTIALRLLREAGWVETHPYLLRIHNQLRVWTQKDGWLDWLEKPPR